MLVTSVLHTKMTIFQRSENHSFLPVPCSAAADLDLPSPPHPSLISPKIVAPPLKQMNTLAAPVHTVCVGSTNPVKVNAVTAAFQRCGITVKAVGVKGVQSGVPDQPIGYAQTKRGAINRAKAALVKRTCKIPSYAVGIEGGLVTSSNGVGLDCIAVMAVLNVATGRISTSRTASFTLPPPLSALVRSGKELGDADDEVFQRTNSKQEDGTVGILTKGAIDRTEYYVHALVLALVPLLHPTLYGDRSLSTFNIQSSWWQRYSFQLREHPIRTKCHTSGVTTALGSIVGQLLAGGSFSWRKVLAFGAFGEFFTGPIIHYWTSWLLPTIMKSIGPNVLVKTLIDRLLFHPPFQYFFLVFVSLLQGKVSMDTAMANTNVIFAGVIRKALIFWPPLMYIIFNKLPVPWQPVGSNLTAFVWSAYLGWSANK